MIWSHLLLSFDLYVDLKTNGTWHSRLVRPLLCRSNTNIISLFITRIQLSDMVAPIIIHSANSRPLQSCSVARWSRVYSLKGEVLCLTGRKTKAVGCIDVCLITAETETRSWGGGVLDNTFMLFVLTDLSLGVICTCQRNSRFPTRVLLFDDHTSERQKGWEGALWSSTG